MNIFRRMGKLTKGFIILIVIGVLSYFGWKHFNEFGVGGFGGDETTKIALNSWAGFSGIIYANGGMITTPNSIMATKFDGNLEIIQIDVRKDAISSLKNGEVDAIWCTIDVLPIEMGEMSDLVQLNVKEVLKIDDSRGADKFIANGDIKTVGDLKGKRVIFGRGTASHSLLIATLETENMTMDDIIPIEVEDGIMAAKAYMNGEGDAACVWSPDDGDCIDAIPGTWVLSSTKYATSAIMDGLLVKEETLNDPDKFNSLVKICEAWLYVNNMLNTDEQVQTDAAELFAKSFSGSDAFIVLDGIKNVRFSTYGDNVAFFGLDPSYTGVDGKELYSKMSRIYSNLKDNAGNYLAENPYPWVKISDTRIVESMTNVEVISQPRESKITFEKKDNLETAPVISNKTVTINFAVNSTNIDNYSRSVIDNEIGRLANSFGGARFRIEGNTDNTGNITYNRELSYKRAQAIVDYLVDRYSFDYNKFVIVGNGPDKPVADNGTEAGKAANRRTDVYIIKEE